MSRRRHSFAIAVAAVVLALFAAGLWRLFAIRFGAGEVHPSYSTLNTGPMGARAIFDAFGRLGRPTVERNMLPLKRFDGRAGTTLVLAGAGGGFFGEDTAKNFAIFESMVRDGLRVVVTLDPRLVPDTALSKDPMANPWESSLRWPPTGRRGGRGQLDGEETEDERLVSAGERWGFKFEPAINPGRAPKEGWEAVPAAGGPPEAPRWFGVWRWAGLSDDWKPLASVDGRPVIVRREFGRGSLTLASDTVFLSNEALWRSPRPGFLVWLLAGEPRLVFDETLHGTVSSPGVMHLVRRYRLLGFFVGAAVVLGLFVWRAGTSLVPVHESVAEAVERPLPGVEGASGFSNLLRQTIPPLNVLRTCFAEWAKSPFTRRRLGETTVVAVRDMVAAAEKDKRRNPAVACREIAEWLAAVRRGEVVPPPSGAVTAPGAKPT